MSLSGWTMLMPDDRVAQAGEPDADDAGGVAAHGPDLGLGEAGELALGRGDDDVVVAGGDVHPGELVVVGDGDRPDARTSGPARTARAGSS